jgi:bis(5'-nucleosyl)-tetraphosphatase (symmetrical)
VSWAFVGDVQGCADELEELLQRLEAERGSDCALWFVGDLVNRGPSSLRVLARVRELAERGRARCVLGNHELHLLRTAFGLRRPGPSDRFEELLGRRDLDDWIDWIRALPPTLEDELVGERFVLVHAALHPDWRAADVAGALAGVRARLAHADRDVAVALLAADPLADPDADALARVTSCRSVRAGGGWSAEPPGSDTVAWHAAWRARGHAYGIVYGHWSLQGLHVAPGLRGLDTGCVHHGRGRDGLLTAWIPDERPDPFGVPDDRFLQVLAHARYWRAG